MFPIIFELGPITIYSMWVFIAIGFIAGSMIFVKLAKRNRVKLTALTEHSFTVFLWTIIISRLAFVILNWDLYFYQFDFKDIFKIFAIWDKGFSFWGAIFAWFILVWHFSEKSGESALKLFDIMIPSILTGMIFGNIGTFLDGVNYGIPTNLPWGITFRSANVKYISDIHPTQLYASIYSAILVFCLLSLIKRNRGRLEGFVTEIGVALFSFLKFIEEFLRGDETIKIFGIRTPQLLALAAFVISAYLIYIRYINKNGGDPDGILKKFVSKFWKSNRSESAAKITSFQNPAIQIVQK